MPRIPKKDEVISTCINPSYPIFPKKPYCPQPQYDNEQQELAIAEILNSIENRMVPKALTNIDLLQFVDKDAYIFVDNNGLPTKVNLKSLAEKFDLEIKIDGGEIK